MAGRPALNKRKSLQRQADFHGLPFMLCIGRRAWLGTTPSKEGLEFVDSSFPEY